LYYNLPETIMMVAGLTGGTLSKEAVLAGGTTKELAEMTAMALG
jgi:hypothetical protein